MTKIKTKSIINNKSKLNCIVNRASTMRYEISNYLSYSDVSYPVTEKDDELKNSILNNNGLCEYCEEREATTQDHYYPLIIDKIPTKYCSDLWNMIPCCHTCNSSKRNIIFWGEKGWFNGKSIKNPFKNMSLSKKKSISNKFLKYEEEFQNRHYEKEVPMNEINDIYDTINVYLEQLQEKTKDAKNKTTFTRKCDDIPIICSSIKRIPAKKKICIDKKILSISDLLENIKI